MDNDLKFMGIFDRGREGWIYREKFYHRTNILNLEGERLWIVIKGGDKKTRAAGKHLERIRDEYLQKHLKWEAI